MPQTHLDKLSDFLTKFALEIEAESRADLFDKLFSRLDELPTIDPTLVEYLDSLKIEVVRFAEKEEFKGADGNALGRILAEYAVPIVAHSLKMGLPMAAAKPAQEGKEDGPSRAAPELMADYFGVTARGIKDRLKKELSEAETNLLGERRKRASHEARSIERTVSKFEFMHYVPEVVAWLRDFSESFKTYEHISNRIRQLMVAELSGIRSPFGGEAPEKAAHVFLRIAQLVEHHSVFLNGPQEFPADLLNCEMVLTNECNTSFFLESDMAVREPFDCLFFIRSITAKAVQVADDKEDRLNWGDVGHVLETAAAAQNPEGPLGRKVRSLILETKARLEQTDATATSFLVCLTQDTSRILMRAYNIHLLENEIRGLREEMHQQVLGFDDGGAGP